MQGNSSATPIPIAVAVLFMLFGVVSATTSISIYTDSNVTTPSLTTNTVQIMVGGAYDNGQVDVVANFYPGLSTKPSVQSFGKNTILVGCGPCVVGSNDIISAANSFTSQITVASNGALSYNGIQIVDLNGNALALIVTGSYPSEAEKVAAKNIASAIATLTSPTTTTTQTTTIVTTSTTTILRSTTVAQTTTLSTTLSTTLPTATVQQAQQGASSSTISSIINAILNFFRSF